jgi:hypothetical protein
MARNPGGSLRPLPPRRQQWRLCAATALRAQGVNADAGQPDAAGRQSIATVPKIAARGCRKAAQEPEPGSREPDGAPRKTPPGLPGRRGNRPRAPQRHPRTRRTPGPSAGTDGAWAHGGIQEYRSGKEKRRCPEAHALAVQAASRRRHMTNSQTGSASFSFDARACRPQTSPDSRRWTCTGPL